MKNTLFYLLFAAMALLAVSCKSNHFAKYDIIVNDTANCLNEKDINTIKSTELPEDYQVIVETVDNIEKGKLARYSRKQRKYYKKSLESTSNLIIITYIRDYRLIITEVPATLQNYIDYTYPAEYFNLQQQCCLTDMIAFMNTATTEYNQLSSFKKNAFTESVSSFVDSVFLFMVPQNSILYKIIFYIPLHIASWLFTIFHSIFGCVVFLLILLVVIRYISLKFFKITIVNVLIYRLISFIAILVVLSFYMIITPKMEYVWLFNAYGFNSNFTEAVHQYFTFYEAGTASWLIKLLFCLSFIIAQSIKDPLNVVLAFCEPEAQRNHYKNTTTFEKFSILLDETMDRVGEFSDYEKSDMPYTDMFTKNFGHSLSSSLFYSIPACLLLGRNVILIFLVLLIIVIVEKLCSIVINYKTFKELGVTMF